MTIFISILFIIFGLIVIYNGENENVGPLDQPLIFENSNFKFLANIASIGVALTFIFLLWISIKTLLLSVVTVFVFNSIRKTLLK